MNNNNNNNNETYKIAIEPIGLYTDTNNTTTLTRYWPNLESDEPIYESLLNRVSLKDMIYTLGADHISSKKRSMFDCIEKVIFNKPATIVLWRDGSKTVVKCEGEKFDPEKGLAMAITKKLLGNNQGYYYDVFKKWLPKKETKNKNCTKKNK